MLPSKAREELLCQHAALRDLLGQATKLAGRVLASAAHGKPDVPDLPELHRVLARLQAAMATHNVTEEALLEPMLRDADAWAPQRIARMMEEHRGEHAVFCDALVGTDLVVAARLRDLAEELDAHMMAEERTFLSPAVLRDDVLNLESSS
jgi:iron-sulfur cluster repair protein YtfE (RIC family)